MGGRNLTRRRLPRAQREANLQRIVLVTSAVVGGVVAVLVILALVNELIIVPNRVIATVNGTEILAVDYQDRYRYELGGQGGQLPQGQISSNPEIEFGRRILDSMISSIILEEAAEEAGITVTEEEIREEIELAFGYDAGEPEPTGTPTATPIGAEREPTATPTLVFTPTPTITPTPDPTITPTATVEITPTEPVTITPAPTPTPLDEAAYEQTIDTYLTNLGFASSLPRDEVEDLLFDVARVQLLTTRLFEAYEADVPTEEEQVRVGIIRVSEEDSVEEIEERLAEGEEFTVVAAELSEDQITNLRGGDIGWQSLEDLEARYNEDFAATIFALDEGEVSEMLEDGETFYYFTVFERDVRQLSAQEIRSRRVEEFNAFLDEQRETATIDIREDWVEFIP